MASQSSSAQNINEIRAQEEDIFDELGEYDFQNEPAFRRNYRLAKLKAKQQLALSEDSPFAHLTGPAEISESERRKLKEERAALLREETNQIKEQLNLVKRRLQEIKSGNSNPIGNTRSPPPPPQPSHPETTSPARQQNTGTDERRAQQDCSTKRQLGSGKVAKPVPAIRNSDTKFRPLTGAADCPNCACDIRRRSICDRCQEINSTSTFRIPTSASKPSTGEPSKCFVDYSDDYDNRPIRPAKDKTLAKVVAVQQPATATIVEETMVPGKVYTISKSLNEKRTKLAQAIDELQRMMEQVKQRSNKLEEERKLVQLYKSQWKFGPSIGGPRSSSRDRLGLSTENRNYESRLDSNLARDSKSLMGFQHIEPSLKLRQYGSNSNNNKPASGRHWNKNTGKVQASGRTVAQASVVSMRSKSLESLKQVQKSRAPAHVVINENFQNGKASSEINLRERQEEEEEEEEDEDDEVINDNDDDGDANDDVEIEEKIEDELELSDSEQQVKVNDKVASAEQRQQPMKQLSSSKSNGERDTNVDREKRMATHVESDKVKRTVWIPVFGETEIKTVKRPVSRKVQIMKPTYGSTNPRRQPADSQSLPARRHIQPRAATVSLQLPKRVGPSAQAPSASSCNIAANGQQQRTSRVLNEATRKLRFATDLLDQEKNDSRNKNQLLINRRPVEIVVREDGTESSAPETRAETPTARGITLVESATQAEPEALYDSSSRRELARIEEMVNEQQRLLSRLTSLQERQHQVVSPVTVSCSSQCCLLAKEQQQQQQQQQQQPRPQVQSQPIRVTVVGPGKSMLMSNLKERLNKGKLKLARTLEQEREKHHQLKQKIDSSLRKQSDLQQENELLKQSLSKCIDNCLRDISSTFESIGETLNDHMLATTNGCENPPLDYQDRRELAASAAPPTNREGRMVQRAPSGGEGGASSSSASQLIADNKYLEQMRARIEAIENERKRMSEELKREKERSLQLEEKLKTTCLGGRKSVESNREFVIEPQPIPGCSKDSDPAEQQDPATRAEADRLSPPVEAARQATDDKENSPGGSRAQDQQCETPELDDSQGSSMELYRRYIESMSPDIQSIRRERKLILSEFDNIKKMLLLKEHL